MTISRVDLTEANGYILEEQGSAVIQDLIANSAVERFARREAMASRTKSVPRFVGDAPVVVAEGAEIPASNPTLDEIVLTARKYAQLMHISEEDVNDSLVDTLAVYKREWASRWARKYDNACLGVTAAGDGDDGQPYTSLYRAVSPGSAGTNLIQTGGALSYHTHTRSPDRSLLSIAQLIRSCAHENSDCCTCQILPRFFRQTRSD